MAALLCSSAILQRRPPNLGGRFLVPFSIAKERVAYSPESR